MFGTACNKTLSRSPETNSSKWQDTSVWSESVVVAVCRTMARSILSAANAKNGTIQLAKIFLAQQWRKKASSTAARARDWPSLNWEQPKLITIMNLMHLSFITLLLLINYVLYRWNRSFPRYTTIIKKSIFRCNAGISVLMKTGVWVLWSNSSPLGLENTLNLIRYLFLGFEKPQFGSSTYLA